MRSVADMGTPGQLGRAWSPVSVRPEDSPDLRPNSASRALMLGFLRLAVASLLVTGIFVLLVAVARTPLVVFAVGRDFLYTALVTHVIFALDIWLLSFVAALWSLAAARMGAPLPARAAWLGMVLAWLGASLLVIVPLTGLGTPVMADYVPMLVHPLFFLGLGMFALGIALNAVGFLVAMTRARAEVPLEARALGFAAVGYLGALVVFLLAGLRWGTGDLISLVWGGGHLFQVVNSAGLIAVWLIMVPARERLARLLIQIGLLGYVPAIVVVALVQVTALRWDEISMIFWAGTGAPIVVAWLVVTATLARRPAEGRRDITFLLFSLGLFAVGGLIALPGMGADTRVTAHYHATVGAVTLAFMGLTYRLLPQLGIDMTWRRLARAQPHLYGWGLSLLVAGLFLAGEAGTARKIFESISSDPSLIFAAALFGLGALVTVVGGVVFVFGVGASLLRKPGSSDRSPYPAAQWRAGRIPLGS